MQSDALPELASAAQDAIPLIQRYGDDERQIAVQHAMQLVIRFGQIKSFTEIRPAERSQMRDAIYRVNSELKLVTESKMATRSEKATAAHLRALLHGAVEYAPVLVRLLSAACLGIGTMVGYRRIVTAIGERIGNKPLTPAQASAELVGALLIGTAGFSGLPVSTTHIISSGVAGTMAGSGAGVQHGVIWQIIIAWVLTLPATTVLAGGLFLILGG